MAHEDINQDMHQEIHQEAEEEPIVNEEPPEEEVILMKLLIEILIFIGFLAVLVCISGLLSTCSTFWSELPPDPTGLKVFYEGFSFSEVR